MAANEFTIAPAGAAQEAEWRADEGERLLVVGLGASAGGLEALERFLQRVSPDSGLAYVVVQHLSPEHESSLADILSRATKLPVVTVTEGCASSATTCTSFRRRRASRRSGQGLHLRHPATACGCVLRRTVKPRPSGDGLIGSPLHHRTKTMVRHGRSGGLAPPRQPRRTVTISAITTCAAAATGTATTAPTTPMNSTRNRMARSVTSGFTCAVRR
jgi:CheB methylesterase